MVMAQWLMPGTGPFSVTMTPIEVGESGEVCYGNGITLTGVVDSIDLSTRNSVENISSVGQRLANYVIVETETSLTLVEILKARGCNFLAQVNSQYDMVKVGLTRGDQHWSFIGVISEYTEKIRKDKSCGTMILLQINIGSKNPIYS